MSRDGIWQDHIIGSVQLWPLGAVKISLAVFWIATRSEIALSIQVSDLCEESTLTDAQ